MSESNQKEIDRLVDLMLTKGSLYEESGLEVHRVQMEYISTILRTLFMQSITEHLSNISNQLSNIEMSIRPGGLTQECGGVRS